MSRSIQSFAKALSRNIENALAIRDMIVVAPTHHVARGFLIEQTLEKGVVYLWRMVVPLFLPMKNVTLNYSDRVTMDGGPSLKIDINGNIDLVAKEVAGFLKRFYIDDLIKIETPEDFLRAFEHRADQRRPNINFELAIAHCLAGQCSIGKRKLEGILAIVSDSPILPKIQEFSRVVLAALERGPDSFSRQIAEFEQQNLNEFFPGLTNQLGKSN